MSDFSGARRLAKHRGSRSLNEGRATPELKPAAPSLKAAESALDAYAAEIAPLRISRKVFRVTSRSAGSRSNRMPDNFKDLQRCAAEWAKKQAENGQFD